MANPFPWLRRVPGVFLARVMTRPLQDPVPGARPRSELEYRVCAEEDLRGWCADRDLGLDLPHLRAAFERGDCCVGMFDSARLIGYVWYAFGVTPDAPGVWIEIPGHARYAYKAFLLPEYRGRGIGNEMYLHAGQVCPRKGRTAGICFVFVDNRASLRAAEKAGWRTIGHAGYVRKKGLFAAFRSPGAWRAGFRFYRPVAALISSSLRPSSPAAFP